MLAFAHLNLRHNPFGALTLDRMGDLAQVELDEYRAHLEPSRAAVQFVGDKGFGKTTRLMALRQTLAGAEYVRVAPETRTPLPDADPLLLDEAQNLGWWRRRRLFAGNRRLVLGTHVDFARELRRAGRPVVTISVARETTAQRLQDLIAVRIAAARRGAGPVPVVDDRAIQILLGRHGPNVREILAALYERFQTLKEPGHVKV